MEKLLLLTIKIANIERIKTRALNNSAREKTAISSFFVVSNPLLIERSARTELKNLFPYKAIPELERTLNAISKIAPQTRRDEIKFKRVYIKITSPVRVYSLFP